MMLFLAGLAGWLHVNRGSKGLHIGPTLANQMAIAHELDRRGLDIAQPSPVMPVRLFPHALATLRRLDRRAGGLPRPANPASRRAIEVVYVDPDGPSGEITLGAVQPAQAGSR